MPCAALLLLRDGDIDPFRHPRLHQPNKARQIGVGAVIVGHVLPIGQRQEVIGLGRKDAVRTRNMYALGLLNWMYSRPVEPTIDFLAGKFAGIVLVEVDDAKVDAARLGLPGRTTMVGRRSARASTKPLRA